MSAKSCPECGWLDDISNRPSCPWCDGTGFFQLDPALSSGRNEEASGLEASRRSGELASAAGGIRGGAV